MYVSSLSPQSKVTQGKVTQEKKHGSGVPVSKRELGWRARQLSLIGRMVVGLQQTCIKGGTAGCDEMRKPLASRQVDRQAGVLTGKCVARQAS